MIGAHRSREHGIIDAHADQDTANLVQSSEYVAPTVADMGTFEELTQGAGGGLADAGKGTS